MVAFNSDAQLYEFLTRVRAYGNEVNLAAVNHGELGGSFLWARRRSHGCEHACLRGGGLILMADLKTPMKKQYGTQSEGAGNAPVSAACHWLGHHGRRFRGAPAKLLVQETHRSHPSAPG